MLNRTISAKFLIHRICVKTSLSKFQRIFHLPKNGGYFEFSNFFAKITKPKMLVSRKPCQISANFFTHRVCLKTSLSKFQRMFHLPKNGSHFEFSNFSEKCKTHKCLYKHQIASVSLTVQDRAISSKFFKHCIQDNFPAQEPLFLYSGFVEL